jgi:hypothetical protein
VLFGLNVPVPLLLQLALPPEVPREPVNCTESPPHIVWSGPALGAVPVVGLILMVPEPALVVKFMFPEAPGDAAPPVAPQS